MSSTIESTLPPIHAADANARIALEVAITKVEVEAVHRNSAAASSAVAPPFSEAAPSPRGARGRVWSAQEAARVRNRAGAPG
jgi:hypothetical protein